MFSGLKKMLSEQKAESEWSSIYMLLVFVIAALVLIALIKPMFRKSQSLVSSSGAQAATSSGK